MKKDELERQNQELREQSKRLASLLRSTQARALGCIRFLEQGLRADDTCDETGSEQVTRCDDAMKQTLIYLTRIVAPAAQTQEQADQTVQQLRGNGLQLDDALKQYIAGVFEDPLPDAVTADALNIIERAMTRAMRSIALYVDDPDEWCDISPLTEAWGVLCEAVAFAQSTSYRNGSQTTMLMAALIETAEELIANIAILPLIRHCM